MHTSLIIIAAEDIRPLADLQKHDSCHFLSICESSIRAQATRDILSSLPSSIVVSLIYFEYL